MQFMTVIYPYGCSYVFALIGCGKPEAVKNFSYTLFFYSCFKLTTTMKKITVLLFLLVYFKIGYSQVSGIKGKMEVLLKKTTSTSHVYINRVNKILELEIVVPGEKINYRIPYFHTHFTYQLQQDRYFKYTVNVSCSEQDNCILDENTKDYLHSIIVSLSNKEDCYNFIELIAQLKNLDNN